MAFISRIATETLFTQPSTGSISRNDEHVGVHFPFGWLFVSYVVDSLFGLGAGLGGPLGGWMNDTFGW